MTRGTGTSLRKATEVAAGREHAFRVFAENVPQWWPTEYRISGPGGELKADVREGGRWYELGADGTEHTWCSVPSAPTRLVLAWQIDGSWRCDPDLTHASEVEVRFIETGPSSTRVELEHRHFERHGDGADAVRQGVSGGWPRCLDRFAELAAR